MKSINYLLVFLIVVIFVVYEKAKADCPPGWEDQVLRQFTLNIFKGHPLVAFLQFTFAVDGIMI